MTTLLDEKRTGMKNAADAEKHPLRLVQEGIFRFSVASKPWTQSEQW